MTITSILPATAWAAGQLVGQAVGALGQLDQGFRQALAPRPNKASPATPVTAPIGIEPQGILAQTVARHQDATRETQRLGQELMSILAAGGVDTEQPIVLARDDDGTVREVGGNSQWREIEKLMSLDPSWSKQLADLERLYRAATPGDALTRFHLAMSPDSMKGWLA